MERRVCVRGFCPRPGATERKPWQRAIGACRARASCRSPDHHSARDCFQVSRGRQGPARTGPRDAASSTLSSVAPG
eukprot:11190930-Lingulodinium_polyedra.AAC.1